MADVKELNINNTTYDIKAKSIVNQNGGAVKTWTGTRAQYDAITTKDANTLYFLTDVGLIYLGETLISNNSNGKNIGELVYSSLPQTDAGLHLLDGALIQGSGSYSAFVDYIADLYTNNPTANYFTDETTWQNTVTQYGVCGKFVYDSTNNTVRLPKVTGMIEGTIDTSALGDLVQAGLPLNWLEHKHTRGDMNITGNTAYTYLWDRNNHGNGAFYWGTSGGGCNNGESAGTGAGSGNFDASRTWTGSTSTPNYTSLSHDASTVQPQTIKCFIYIVIANSTKTDIQVDIDEIATDLNGKADTDLTNVNNTAKVLMSGMGMPSNRYINLTLGPSGSTYTAPANGYYNIARNATAQGQYVDLVNNTTGFFVSMQKDTGGMIRICAPVRKGDVLQINYTAAGNSYNFFRFFYAQGSESEGA